MLPAAEMPDGVMYAKGALPWAAAIRNAQRIHRRKFGNRASVAFCHPKDQAEIKMSRVRIVTVPDPTISIRGNFIVRRIPRSALDDLKSSCYDVDAKNA